jgi:oligosaccharyltransferase complex subunit gamma
LPVIQNRNFWAAISLISILLFTSGHMFNHIRKVPYVAGDGRGGISYFAGGFQNQFGLETQIVAAMCMSPLYPLPPYLLVILHQQQPRNSSCTNARQMVSSPSPRYPWLSRFLGSLTQRPSRSLFWPGLAYSS